MAFRMLNRPPVKVLIAAPRGFCAGVDRAIQIVELALERFGAPVYVRHEIVHNRFVVDRLRKLGAIFIDELDEVPDDRPVVFSAHGVPKSVPAVAQSRGLTYVDATCPLVSKVHRQADRMLVIGAPNSSNSLRLAEVAQRIGVQSRLIERATDIDWEWIGQPRTIGVTAGASAPELLVQEVVDALRERFNVTEEIADHSP